jgi:hypothetical protein
MPSGIFLSETIPWFVAGLWAGMCWTAAWDGYARRDSGWIGVVVVGAILPILLLLADWREGWWS